MKYSKKIILIAYSSFLAINMLSAQPDIPKSKEYFENGSAKIEQGNYKEAINDLNRAISLYPSFTEGYEKRGYAKMQAGDSDGAVYDFTQAIRLQPMNTTAYKNRGLVKSQRSDFQGALYDFNKAIGLAPEDAQLYLLRGKTCEKMGLSSQAEADRDMALRLGLDNSVAENVAVETPAAGAIINAPRKSPKAEEKQIINSFRPKANAPIENNNTIEQNNIASISPSEIVIEQPKRSTRTEVVEAQPVVEEIVAVQPKEQPKRPIRTEVVEAQPVVEEVVAVQPKEQPKRPIRTEVVEAQPVVEEVVAVQPKEQPKRPIRTEVVEAQPVVEEIVAVQPKEQPKRPIRTEVVEAQPVVEEVVAVQPKESSNPTPRPSQGETTEEPKTTTKIAAEDGLIVEEVRTKSSRPKTSRGSVVKTEKSNGADLAVVIEDTKPVAAEPAKKNKTIESVEYNDSSVKSFVTPTSEKTPKRTVESEEAATGMSPEDIAKMKLYQEAVQKAKEDNHRGAVNLYDQLLQKDPNFIMAYLNRGISRNAIEDFSGSIADLDKVIKQKPDMPEAYYSRGNTYYDMQEFNKAIEDFNTVIELRHDYVQAYMNRALSKRNLGDTMGCCEDWQKAKEFGSAKAKKNIEIYCPNEKEKAYNEQQQKLLQQGAVTPP